MDNIVLVTIDSLRADCCGFVNDGMDTTPFLDKLAESGVTFENAIAPGPRTPSSMPVAFTGDFYQYEGHNLEDWRERRKEIASHLQKYQSLASMLDQIGYSTIGLTANPWTATDTRFDEGFDTFQELHPNNKEGLNTLPDSTFINTIDRLFSYFGEETLSWDEHKEWFSHWTGFYDIIQQHAESAEEPFFLWIFLMDSHHPYITPREFRQEASLFDIYYSLFRFWRERQDEIPDHVGNKLQKSYRDTVRSADAFVERLYNDLSNRTDFTFVFHADHGEAHGDHGIYGHEYQLYEENIHIPWLVHDGETQERIQYPTSIKDMKSVLRNIANGNQIDEGIDPKPVISKVESNDIAADRGNMLNYTPHSKAIRGTRWKLIETNESSMLYDLTEDPNEQENLASQYQEVYSDLKNLLKAYEDDRSERKRIVDASEELVGDQSQL